MAVESHTVTTGHSLSSSIRWLLSIKISQGHFVMYTSYHAAPCDGNQLCLLYIFIVCSHVFTRARVCVCVCVCVCVSVSVSVAIMVPCGAAYTVAKCLFYACYFSHRWLSQSAAASNGESTANYSHASPTVTLYNSNTKVGTDVLDQPPSASVWSSPNC